MGTIVIIPKCRLSYPILGVPERYKNDPKNKPRWGANFWIPKTDLAMVAKIDQTIRDVAREKWPKTWEKVLPEILLDKKGCCWIDGKRRSEDTADDYWTIAAYRDAEKGKRHMLSRRLIEVRGCRCHTHDSLQRELARTSIAQPV